MNMVKPDGSTVWVPNESISQAQQSGYRSESMEEAAKRHAGDQPLRAGLEGAARGFTGGLSDPFMKGYGVPSEDIRNRKEENPIASTVGEGVGVAAGLKFPGVPSLIAKAGEGAGALATGKAGQRLLTGATEGSLWGLSSAITEDTIGDKQLSAEQLQAGVVASALTGGVANVVLGTAGDLGRSALIKAFGGRPFRDTLRDLAEQSVVRSVTLPSDYAKKNLRERAGDIGRRVLDEDIARPFESAEKAAERATTHAAGTYSEMERVLGDADQKAAFLPTRAAARMQSMVDGWKGEMDSGTRGRLQGIVDDFTGPERPKTFADAFKRQSEMRLQVGDQEPKLFKDKLFQLRGELQDELFTQAEKITGDDLRGLNKKYADVAAFRDLATKKADRGKQNLPIGLTDMLAGDVVGGALGGVGGLLSAPIAAVGNKLARERGGFVVASALDKLADSKTLQRVADATQKWLKGKLAMPDFTGPFRAVLETAVAKSAMDALKTHIALTNSDPDYLAMMGSELERPETVADHTDRAERLSRFANAVDQQTGEIDGALQGFYAGQKGASDKLKTGDYDATMTQLRELASQVPELPKGLAQIAPSTVALASMQVANTAQYLIDRAPKNPYENLPPALKQPWAPADSELSRWYRHVHVASNPMEALAQMRRGELSIEAVDTLQNLYPRLYREFRDRANAQLSQLSSQLGYDQKKQLELLLGVDFGTPQQLALIQTIHSRNIPPVSTKPPDGRQKVSQAGNQATQAQRLENKQAQT